MTCQTIGRPPFSTGGLGIDCVCSCSRVPLPPQRMTTDDPSMRGRSLAAAAQEARQVAYHGAAELARRELQRADADLAARRVVARLGGGERRQLVERETQRAAADPDADHLHRDRRVA